MWYIIIAIISGAVGAVLMGLFAGIKIKEAANEAYWLGVAQTAGFDTIEEAEKLWNTRAERSEE